MMENNILPFLTQLVFQGREYIGIVLNSDDKILSFYDLDRITRTEEKTSFLELGDIWWHESNRLLPINIFLRDEMMPFQYSIKTLNRKDITILQGPCTSLNDLIKKRIKKRQIMLVRKPPKSKN